MVAGPRLARPAPPSASRTLNSPRSSPHARVAKPRARLGSQSRQRRRTSSAATLKRNATAARAAARAAAAAVAAAEPVPVPPASASAPDAQPAVALAEPTPARPPPPQLAPKPELAPLAVGGEAAASPPLSPAGEGESEDALVAGLAPTTDLASAASVGLTLRNLVAVLEWSHRVMARNLTSATEGGGTGAEEGEEAESPVESTEHVGLYDGVYDGVWLCQAAPLEALTAWMSPQDDAVSNSQVGLLSPEETLAFYAQIVSALELPPQLVFAADALVERRDLPAVAAALAALGRVLGEALFVEPDEVYPFELEQALLTFWVHREGLRAASARTQSLFDAWSSEADSLAAFSRLSRSEAAVELDGSDMKTMAEKWLEPEYMLDPALLEMGGELGEGAFGQVYKAEYAGEVTAVKEITIDDSQLPPFVVKAFLKLIVREVRLLQELSHPNVLTFVGAVFPDSGGLSFRLVTEFMERDTVRKVVDTHGHALGWHIRLRMAADAARGMGYLHAQNILHRDLKSENLFVTAEWRTKLGDFGFARVAATSKDIAEPAAAAPKRSSRRSRSRARMDRSRMTVCGTEDFMAPELRMGKAYDSTADVFSFGIVLFEILTGLQADDPPLARDRGSAYSLDYSALRAYIPASAPPPLVAMAIAATAPDADARPTMPQILFALEQARTEAYGAVPWASFIADLLATSPDASVDDALAALAAAEDEWFAAQAAALTVAPLKDTLNVDGTPLRALPFEPADEPDDEPEAEPTPPPRPPPRKGPPPPPPKRRSSVDASPPVAPKPALPPRLAPKPRPRPRSSPGTLQGPPPPVAPKPLPPTPPPRKGPPPPTPPKKPSSPRTAPGPPTRPMRRRF